MDQRDNPLITPTSPQSRAAGWRLPNIRWWIVGMLFVGSVVNYLDRIAVSIVAPIMRDEFGLSASEYALTVNVFLVAYTFSYAFGGKLADWLGTRLTYYVTVTLVVHCRLFAYSLSRSLFPLLVPFLVGSRRGGVFPDQCQGHIGMVSSSRSK